jgi:hypothetical protein
MRRGTFQQGGEVLLVGESPFQSPSGGFHTKTNLPNRGGGDTCGAGGFCNRRILTHDVPCRFIHHLHLANRIIG